MSPDQGILAFDGIRKIESSRRSNYSRISNDHKIAREILARPILEWSDSQVWFYMLSHGLSFNQAYKKGFRRVVCLFCPFNSDWSQLMLNERYPIQWEKWQMFLAEQAIRMKHPNPEVFVERGWRSRAGGRGLDFYKSAVESTPCILSDNAVQYQLLSGDIHLLRHFLRPLGPQSIVNKDEYLESFLIHDYKSNKILASVEIGYIDQAVRVNYLINKNKRLFRQRVEKQIKKLQVCIFCGACGAKCKSNALDSEGHFLVDESKCISCLACISHNCPIVKSLHYKGTN
jgi:phosphoadenosine phosphosulfate reductase